MKRTKVTYCLMAVFCFMTLHATHAQSVEWLTSAAGDNEETSSGVCSDENGNVYATGSFLSTTLTFGTEILTNAGGRDVFVVKYDADGQVLWAKSPGGTLDAYAAAIDVDDDGNIYVTGSFQGSLTFGTTVLTNSGTTGNDIFVVKYDTNGEALWAKSAGGSNSDEVYSIVHDKQGNVYIGGYSLSTTSTFGSVVLQTSGVNPYGLYVAKFNAENGNVSWATCSITDHAGRLLGLAVDQAGNVYATGGFWGATLNFGTTALNHSNSTGGPYDIFIAKYDSNGQLVWAKTTGTETTDYAQSAAVDSQGNLYVSGYFSGATIVFENSTLTSAGNNDAFLVKYNSTGNLLWAKNIGSTGHENGYKVVTDESDNVYISGYFNTTMTVGAKTLIGSGNFDIYLLAYDPSGSLLWAESAGGDKDDFLYELAATNGNLYATGVFKSSTLTFGSLTVNNSTEDKNAVFVVKITNDITPLTHAAEEDDLEVFPNPSKNKVQVSNSISGKYEIKFFTQIGACIYQLSVIDDKVEVDVSAYPRGLYIYQLQKENGIIKTGRLILD